MLVVLLLLLSLLLLLLLLVVEVLLEVVLLTLLVLLLRDILLFFCLFALVTLLLLWLRFLLCLRFWVWLVVCVEPTVMFVSLRRLRRIIGSAELGELGVASRWRFARRFFDATERTFSDEGCLWDFRVAREERGWVSIIDSDFSNGTCSSELEFDVFVRRCRRRKRRRWRRECILSVWWWNNFWNLFILLDLSWSDSLLLLSLLEFFRGAVTLVLPLLVDQRRLRRRGGNGGRSAIGSVKRVPYEVLAGGSDSFSRNSRSRLFSGFSRFAGLEQNSWGFFGWKNSSRDFDTLAVRGLEDFQNFSYWSYNKNLKKHTKFQGTKNK